MRRILTTILHVMQRWFRRSNSTNWLPSTVYPDDVFIVSYPKSGNTWVRFLIANLLKQQNEEIDFYTVNRYVPEVGRHEEIIAGLKRPRIMKSHAPYVREISQGYLCGSRWKRCLCFLLFPQVKKFALGHHIRRVFEAP